MTMELSKEKQALLALPDEEIARLLSMADKLRRMEQKEKHTKEVPGSAYAQLQELVGLSEVKKTVDRIIAFERFRKAAKLRGKILERPNMHMQMLGGPGTAKTTVARLLASIFKEIGLCTKGTFVEAGRADLISDHVGGTAPKTEAVCRKAKGGVLFIDEAYSFSDEGNSFCGEFVATLIAQMENYRDDLIVIFAGYEQEMENFIKSNPGLRSRVSFALHFPDYTTDELLDITRFIAAKKGFEIAEGANERLVEQFRMAQQGENFGNARYIRNHVERAIMNKAVSIQYRDALRMSDEEMFTLQAKDFVVDEQPVQKSANVRRIGFCA